MTTERAIHTLTPDEALDALQSDRNGLTAQEAAGRLEQYGPNEIQQEEQTSPLTLFLEQFRNPFVYVLVFAALMSLLGGHETDAIVIAVIILVNAIIGFVQENQAEQALRALQERSAPEATVRRVVDGESKSLQIPAREVVPGDILVLSTGDKIPADGRLIEAINLEVDEAMLTGESVSADKDLDVVDEHAGVADRTNLVYAATAITRGRGLAVAAGTGSNTEIGRIATLLQETEKGEGPLQQQMGKLSKYMAYLALGLSTTTFLVGLLRGFDLQSMFMLALASAVSAIPEGLPAVMTITMAVGVNRMAKRNAIIRRLRAVDTLGAATVIVSDKTGTLTTNEMTAQRLYLDDRIIDVSGAGWHPEGTFSIDGRDIQDPAEDSCLRRALEVGMLCNDAQVDMAGDADDGSQTTTEVHGDPTEAALVVLAAKAGLHRSQEVRRYRRVDEIPFDSHTRYMATFHTQPDSDLVMVYVKGAPERLLEMSHAMQAHDCLNTLDEHEGGVLAASENMARDALRVLGLAYAEIAGDEVTSFKERLEQGERLLTFLGLVGMMDPPRPEAAESVAQCQRAGIQVIMATGDHSHTARAVGTEIGILSEGQDVLSGEELEDLDDDDLDAAVENTRVFARVSPAHKHRLVGALQRKGHVVAMTGDGVNDAPALRAAEVGVAMGITGTDVTKETADMVLTDDNFSSIVAAVEEGRAVFQNLRKVIKFLLATNVGEALTIITSLLIFPKGVAIITAIQILWVNLVTDGILDITIAMEPKEDDVMDEPPRKPETGIVDSDMVRNMIIMGIFMAAGTLWNFSADYRTNGLVHAQTMAFTTLAMFQFFNALNVRSRKKSVFQLGLFTNRWLLGAMALSLVLQILANQLPILQTALGTQPLSLADWGRVIGVSCSVFIVDELRKLLERRRV